MAGSCPPDPASAARLWNLNDAVRDLALVCSNCRRILHRSGVLTTADVCNKLRPIGTGEGC